MIGKLELPRIEMWKAMNGIVREGCGEDEFSFGCCIGDAHQILNWVSYTGNWEIRVWKGLN